MAHELSPLQLPSGKMRIIDEVEIELTRAFAAARAKLEDVPLTHAIPVRGAGTRGRQPTPVLIPEMQYYLDDPTGELGYSPW